MSSMPVRTEKYRSFYRGIPEWDFSEKYFKVVYKDKSAPIIVKAQTMSMAEMLATQEYCRVHNIPYGPMAHRPRKMLYERLPVDPYESIVQVSEEEAKRIHQDFINWVASTISKEN